VLENREVAGMKCAVFAACLFFAASAVSAQSQTVDWKYFGGTVEVDNFFDVAGIQRTADGHPQVWTKALPGKQVGAAIDKALKNKDRLARVAFAKIAAATPIAQVKNLSDDELTSVVLAEEVANNSPEVQPVSRLLLEVDCTGRMIRTLSAWVRLKNGHGQSSDRVSEWSHVPPETGAYNLVAILCPTKPPG
jgi:hypothetical protein